MKTAGVVLAITIALAIQTTLGSRAMQGPAVDLVLVVVVYTALAGGPVPGLLTGAVGGLAQDALSGSIVGLGGLAKTIVGFGAGVFGSQFIVSGPVPRFVVFFVATLVHAGLFLGLSAILLPHGPESPWLAVAGQALANAVVGLVACQVVDLIPGHGARRQVRRRQR